MDVDEHFGPADHRSWMGSLCAGHESIPFKLHWIETGYADYDIDRSLVLTLANQAVAAGRLDFTGRTVELVGKRAGRVLTFVDIALLLEETRLDLPWQEVVDQLRASNRDGGAKGDDQITFSFDEPAGRRVLVALSPRSAEGIPRGTRVEGVSPIPSEDGTLARRTFLGNMTDPDDNTIQEIRIELLAPKIDEPARESAIGIWTVRPRERALAGPVPSGCYWPTRAAFARTLNDLYQAGINWYEGEFNEQANEIIALHLGLKLTEEEFFRQIDETFGSRRAASSALCHIPEVSHLPIAGRFGQESGTFTGFHWAIEPEPTVRHLVSRAMRIRLIERNGTYDGKLWMSYLPRPGGSRESHFADIPFEVKLLDRGD